MFRFFCFNSRVHNPKLKKPVQPPDEAMQEKVQECYLSCPLVDATKPSSLITISLNSGDRQACNSLKNATDLVSVESAGSSEVMNLLGIGKIPQRNNIKKSQSVGSGLVDRGRIAFSDDISEYGTNSNFACDSSNYQNGLSAPDHEHRLNEMHEPYQMCSDVAQNGSPFPITDAMPSPSDKDACENSEVHLSGGSAGQTTCGPTGIIKSHSLPNIGTVISPQGNSHLGNTVSRSRSCHNLHALYKRQNVAAFEFDGQARSTKDDCYIKSEKGRFDDALDCGSESYKYSGQTRDWIMPTMDDASVVKTGQESFASTNGIRSSDFKIKRITDWVNNLQHSCPLEEPNAFLESIGEMKGVTNTSAVLPSSKVDEKIYAAMEVAKRHISSLSPTATHVQLANHGLVVIPFLSAFVSLKMLNLSGNTIVRITAGALPRGLHMLNLSKNNISTVEGLRELSRLRVLDLSYNRLLRIGHGLASCSSLKELYLAGNKISEVEGLHRLLKLNILDLRFNKISTAKCLGQLAANYASLQAISLEGNPAQKNVGDEHLKKYLQSLLPYLAYYNRLPVKTNAVKDAVDRGVRVGGSSHQFDRSLRSDHRTGRKVGHGSNAHRPPASSSHGRRDKHENLRQSTSKEATSSHRHHQLNHQNVASASDHSMRRSRSEGTLGAI